MSDKNSVSKSKAGILKQAVKHKGICKDCADKQAAMSPIAKAIMTKMGFMSANSDDCCHGKPPEAKAGGVVIVTKTDDMPGVKKVLEKSKTESRSAFVTKCINAIIGKVSEEKKRPSTKMEDFKKSLDRLKRKHEQ